MNSIRIHRFLLSSRAEGPGNRAVLWVQGCSRHCKGCVNEAAWDRAGGTERTVQSVFDEIVSYSERNTANALDGITFLGGEPFEQADAAAELAEKLQDKNLSVITFTGFTKEQLEAAHRPDWRRLIAATDLLIDGEFIQKLSPAVLPWVGSTNQKFHYLTERAVQWKNEIENMPNRIEIRFSPDGSIALNGMSEMETWNNAVSMITAPLSLANAGTGIDVK
ncbi:MAG: radical SAM protein [Planctomycetaceae bacterium]|jgi:anaerobic ribonucleoside-triphosphate reductase activating protein|nr:radical SAM protein [Planctomycetaceae bacterium]